MWCGDNVGVELLQSLWLLRLPEITQAILASADSGSLDTLAVIADKVQEVHVRPMVGEVSRNNLSQVSRAATDGGRINSCFNWERLYCTSGQTLVAVYSEIKDLPKHPEKLLIDVREPREIDEYGKIPGSINIPLGALEDTLSSKLENRSFTRKFNRKFPDPTDELIFSCQKGVRAQKASEIATRLGYKKLKGPRSVTSQLDPRNFSIPANILSYVAAQITPQKLCRNFLGCSERRFSEEVVRHRPPESSFFGIRFKLEEIPQNTQRAQGTNPAQCKSVSFCGL
ncbi:uncharacterized protein LOC119648202 isoform X2 [Hermetia illucens]|uniref:uncharacterized protein LOC119648202 isoform X2 n=1 Tax=Hermetia illucens TaxID=343691 RepID=UPI0018CC4727|nr:uncharacterized protein LOC119648202 isoform X2 [Hermetia illucens]